LSKDVDKRLSDVTLKLLNSPM